jgi:hypothetical protein
MLRLRRSLNHPNKIMLIHTVIAVPSKKEITKISTREGDRVTKKTL